MLGISKQAVHKYLKRQDIFDKKLNELIIQVDELRSEHPGCGLEKMYYTLRPDFIGRDRFIEEFKDLGYGVQRVKNYTRTTIPAHLKYPNLIEGMQVIGINQVWQTDITYFRLKGVFYYLVFMLDVYTRKIISYKVSDNLRAEANIWVLKQAIKLRGGKRNLSGLIHHSDRGSQYIAQEYIGLLKGNNINISMGLKGQENAYAERVNGIIKNEYLKRWEINSFEELKRKLREAVNHYNEKRIHSSLPDRLSPNAFEMLLNSEYKEVRPKEIIYSENGKKAFKVSQYFKLEDEPNGYNCPLVCP